MSEKNSVPVTIRILNRDLTVKSSPEEQENLLLAAEVLNERMGALRNKSAHNFENIAILSALNLSYDLLMLKKQAEDKVKIADIKILELQDKISASLKNT